MTDFSQCTIFYDIRHAKTLCMLLARDRSARTPRETAKTLLSQVLPIDPVELRGSRVHGDVL